MKYLFDNLSLKVSKMATEAYSTSFSLGIYFLNSRLQTAVYSIYGFVRIADEIVDSFEGYNREYLLKKFREETFEAIEAGISVNPILNSFQRVVDEYQVGPELIETFLASMEMDLGKVQYTTEKYQRYILGSAEVVGLMCLHVFTERNQKMF